MRTGFLTYIKANFLFSCNHQLNPPTLGLPRAWAPYWWLHENTRFAFNIFKKSCSHLTNAQLWCPNAIILVWPCVKHQLVKQPVKSPFLVIISSLMVLAGWICQLFGHLINKNGINPSLTYEIRLKQMSGGGPILFRGEFLHGTSFPRILCFGVEKQGLGGIFKSCLRVLKLCIRLLGVGGDVCKWLSRQLQTIERIKLN